MLKEDRKQSVTVIGINAKAEMLVDQVIKIEKAAAILQHPKVQGKQCGPREQIDDQGDNQKGEEPNPCLGLKRGRRFDRFRNCINLHGSSSL
jgi:hypothetical protein